MKKYWPFVPREWLWYFALTTPTLVIAFIYIWPIALVLLGLKIALIILVCMMTRLRYLMNENDERLKMLLSNHDDPIARAYMRDFTRLDKPKS